MYSVDVLGRIAMHSHSYTYMQTRTHTHMPTLLPTHTRMKLGTAATTVDSFVRFYVLGQIGVDTDT